MAVKPVSPKSAAASPDVTEYMEVAEALREFYLRSHRLVDRKLSAEGASFAKTKLMGFIARSGSARSTDLAEAFGFAPRTITEAIDALERDGLAERVPDPEDRRVKRISLTKSGQAVLESTAPMRHRFVTQLFEVLSANDRKQLVRLIGRLNEQLDAMSQDAQKD